MVAFISALLPPCQVAAQNVYPDPALNRPLRIEIPATSDKETYRIIPCSAAGFLLFYKSTEAAGENKVRWYFVLYDKFFQQSWIKSVPLNAGVDYTDVFHGRDTLALFFQSPEPDRSIPPDFQVLRVILGKGAFILNNGVLPLQSSMAVFSVVKQTCFTGLNINNDQAQLMILDLPTGKQNFITVGGGTQTSFVAIDVDTSDMTVSAVVRKQLTKRFWDNYFVRMDRNGTVIGETLITTLSPERQLAESRIYSISASEKLVAGSYVLSSSVYEHLDGVEAITRALASLTKPDGLHIHFVDLRDHYFKYPFEMLRFSESSWRNWLNPSSNHNRYRLWNYRRAFEACFGRVEIEILSHEPEAFHKLAPHIRPEFISGNPNEDAVTLIRVIATKPLS